MLNIPSPVSQLTNRLKKLNQSIPHACDLTLEGKLTRIVGLTIEASGCRWPIGHRCAIEHPTRDAIKAEVIGFNQQITYLMSTENTQGLMPGARIKLLSHQHEVAVGEALLGRVIDGTGAPLDGLGDIHTDTSYPMQTESINPLTRDEITQPLDVGIRAINGLLTVGRGQRMGLFSGSGVGKSVLLGMMSKLTQADVCVVGLIGERGREVKEFIEQILGKAGLAKSVVVASPSDTPPLMRLQGAWRATAIAEYFRDQGKQVLLILDSLTRFAHAAREMAISIGEPPATKGYTPSVFSKLSQLVERAGLGGDQGGGITAFYTVLAEGDDQQDPIVDAARSFLDGHIVLSRELANAGHYPAIDIEASVSRVMPHIITQSHMHAAVRFKQLYGAYAQNRDLVNIGAYVKGSDPLLDQALHFRPAMETFLKQETVSSMSFDETQQALVGLLSATPATESQAASSNTTVAHANA